MAEVSIIVPVYNVEKYLARCLDSITSQTFPDIEIVCINDGSTDRSADILKHYAKFDKRIAIITKPNGGLSSARNAGLEVVTGKYIMFVDSDDWIFPEAVEKLYDNAEKNNSDMVLFDYMTGDVMPKKKIAIDVLRNDYVNNPFNFASMNPLLLKEFPVSACFRFYRSDLIKNKIPFVEGLIYEDVPFMFEVFATAKRITHLPEALYFYFQGRDDNIMSDNGHRMFDIIKVMDLSEGILKKYGYFEKYKQVFNLFAILNFTNRFYLIAPEYKEEMFNKLRQNRMDIDYDYYLSGGGGNPQFSQIEKLQVKQFQLMQEPDMTFERFIKIPFGVRYGK